MSIAFEGPGEARYLIYGLIDPRTLLIHYIGRSSRGLTRPRAHANAAKNGKTDSARWIRELQELGLNYSIVVLEVVPREELNPKERWWIAYGRLSCWPLTNQTAGGQGLLPGERNPMHDPAVRAKVSKARIGMRFSEITKQKIREANYRPEIHKAIVERMLTNHPLKKPGVYERIIATKRTPEYRKRLSQKMTGHPVSAETREKIRQSLLARNRR